MEQKNNSLNVKNANGKSKVLVLVSRNELIICSGPLSGLNRLKLLDSIIIDNVNTKMLTEQLGISPILSGKFLSIETLLDCILVLYDECCNSSLRREKTVSDFIELSMIFLRRYYVKDQSVII